MNENFCTNRKHFRIKFFVDDRGQKVPYCQHCHKPKDYSVVDEKREKDGI